MKKLVISAYYCFILIMLDQISKFVACYFLKGESPIELCKWISLQYSENSGVAFSFFSGLSPVYLIICSAVLIFILILLYWMTSNNLRNVAYMLIIAGAVGNIIDRVSFGYVRDFIFFHIPNMLKFPVFNVADSFITVGAVFLVISEIILNSKKS